MNARPWPVELRLDPTKTTLTVAFDSGARFALAAEYLRVESPSAEVQGHGSGEKQIVPGKRHVKIEALEPVGNYAVRIRFDDGHGVVHVGLSARTGIASRNQMADLPERVAA